MARSKDKQPPRTKKYYRSTKSGAGMTKAGVAKYRRDNHEMMMKLTQRTLKLRAKATTIEMAKFTST